MSSTDQRIEAVEATLGSIVDSISQLNSSVGEVLGNIDSLRNPSPIQQDVTVVLSLIHISEPTRPY